ncbi:hypothetical protein SLS62_011280 [Diatrype stigma]|uniref:Uncharacterized protein n=1 Tax=Diatrype stigma TaxID=117547 RepID=A0AAN9U4L8_9PEZI
MDQQRRSEQIHDERSHLHKPQVYVQLQFGVSWNKRHSPSTHSVTYMSRNLRNSRDYGNFPRQVPQGSTSYASASAPHLPSYLQKPRPPPGHIPQQRSQDTHPQARRRAGPEYGRQYSRAADEARLQPAVRTEREARSETRAPSNERGNSAPPPVNENPWDAEGPAPTLFPPPGRRPISEQPQMMKPLPAAPDQFRLGSDGLPWDAYAWPPGTSSEGTDPERRSPFVNNPTVVPLSPQRGRVDDPARVQELESLSTAMMTVDNGFENQWWYQGPRESTDWWARVEPGSRRSMPEAMLVSATEPTFSSFDDFSGIIPPADDRSSGLDVLVSPLSESGSPGQSFLPLQRSLTTRSEELFIGS